MAGVELTRGGVDLRASLRRRQPQEPLQPQEVRQLRRLDRVRDEACVKKRQVQLGKLRLELLLGHIVLGGDGAELLDRHLGQPLGQHRRQSGNRRLLPLIREPLASDVAHAGGQRTADRVNGDAARRREQEPSGTGDGDQASHRALRHGRRQSLQALLHGRRRLEILSKDLLSRDHVGGGGAPAHGQRRRGLRPRQLR